MTESNEWEPDTGDNTADTDEQHTASYHDIDWEREGEPARTLGRREILTLVSILGYLALWAFDFAVRPSHAPFFALEFDRIGLEWGFELAPTNVDWLFGLTLLLALRYVAVPVWENDRQRRYYWRRIKPNRAATASLCFLAFIFVVGVIGPFVLGRPEPQWELGHTPPIGFGGSWAHPFGTTRNGEDLLAITVAGMRVSMQVGLIATTLAIGLATAVGATAAFVGGWVDDVLMRLVDLLMTFPTFFLLLFLVYIYGGDLFVFVLIVAFTAWGPQARLIRSEALQRTEETYITAAEATGASRWYVIRRHIVPNVSNTIVTAATLLIPVVILFEAVIAFLGFGDPDVWSWGRIISDGRGSLRDAWWVSTIPGIFLFLTVLAFNFLGDALRDALDPRHEVDRNR